MKKCIKFLVSVVIIVSVLSSPVLAMEQTNKYIRSGGAYIHRWGAGDISVEYHVFGTGLMDTLGAYRITVYRMKGATPDSASDEIVATYWHEDYPGMMTTDDYFFSSSIRLKVATGQKYYAVLGFYASLDGGGDNMFFSTKPVAA